MEKTSKKSKAKRIVGLDAHPRICVLQVTTGDSPGNLRKVGAAHEVETSQVAVWCKRHLQKDDLIVLEASGNSFAIAGKLTDKGFDAKVLESQQVARFSESRTDNDRISAYRIAKCWVSGTAKVVWQPDADSFVNRELLTCYANCVEDEGRKCNHITGFLNGHANYTKGLRRSLNSPAWRRECLGGLGNEDEKRMLQTYFDEYDHACRMRALYFKRICMKVLADWRMLSLMRIQGIGVVTAFALVAVIGDIRRFPTPGQLCSYVGLVPHGKQSGDGMCRQRGIGNTGRKDLRSYLTECGQSVLCRGKRGTALADWGVHLFMGKGVRAIVVSAMARKICTYAWHLLNGKEVTEDERKVCTVHKLMPLLKEFSKEEIQAMGYATKKAMLEHLVEEILCTPEQCNAGEQQSEAQQQPMEHWSDEQTAVIFDADEISDNQEAWLPEAPACTTAPRAGRLPASPNPTGQGEGYSPISLGSLSAALATPWGGLTPPSPNPTCGKRSLHILGRSRALRQLLTQNTGKMHS